MSDPNIHQDIGELKGRMSSMETRLASLEQEIDRRLSKIEDGVDHIKGAISATKGGWKAITVMTSALAALAASVGWIIEHFTKG